MNEVLVGLAGATVSLVIGILAYQRSKKVDATSAQSGIASNHRAGTAQIIEGLNALVDQLQEDNETFRKDMRELVLRLDAVTKERDALRLELARLQRKYGVNGNGT